jgi:putative SOS response-associated peptidase YedK
MCGRFGLYHSSELLSQHFGLDFGPLEPRYNLAPTQLIPFVFLNANEDRQLGRARWGLVPHWSKEGLTDKPLFNARSETVLKKPAFRDAFIRGRCLIPASGWYEWVRLEDGTKQPHYLKLKTDEPFAFAGLFDVWRSQDGQKRLVSCSILTTASPEDLSWLHDRMPAILDYDDYDLWLDRGTPDIADLRELLKPYPSEELEVYPVGTKVNSARAEGPQLMERAEGPG